MSFTILFALLTNYYQMGTNLSGFIIRHNVSDAGFLLAFYILFYGLLRKKEYPYPVSRHLRWPMICFGLFLAVICLYDYAKGATLVSILQCYRYWLLMLFAIPILKHFPVEVYVKTIRYILYASVFATVLILLDYYAGTHILQEEYGIFRSEGGVDYQRGAIPTTYGVLCTFLLVAGYFKGLKKHTIYLFAGLLLLSVIASMIRSMLFSVLIGCIAVLCLTGKLRFANWGRVVAVAIVVASVVYTTPGLNERILSGWEEIGSVSFSYSAHRKIEGNMSFRLYMLEERLDYVLDRWDRFLFGIGSVREEDFPTTFRIGLYNAKAHRPVQLDTGDIAWPLLFLRLGIVGTCLLGVVWIKMMLLFKRYRSTIGIAMWVFLAISFLLAFCGTTVAKGGFWLLMVMMLFVCNHNDSDELIGKRPEEKLD